MHAVRHPEQIGQRQLERFRRSPADQAGTGPQALPIQPRFRQAPLEGAVAEGARRQYPLPEQFRGQRLHRHRRMRPAQLAKRLHRRRIQRLILPLVRAPLVLQGGKLVVFVSIVPVLDRRCGKQPAVPRLECRLLARRPEGVSVLHRLDHCLHRGESRQGARLVGILISQRECFHAPPPVRPPFPGSDNFVVWDGPAGHFPKLTTGPNATFFRAPSAGDSDSDRRV